MNKIKKVQTKKVSKKSPAQVGRKRDEGLDSAILEATIEILAQVGFDAMTMDMVAASVKAGKASLYRRWPSKAELVRDSLIWMSSNSVNLESIPDNGNLRADLLAVMRPFHKEHSERKLKVLMGLGSFISVHRKLYDEVLATNYGQWSEINKKLMKKAIERGEISKKADIDLACRVIVAMSAHSALNLKQYFDKNAYAEVLDKIILPALEA